MPSRTLSTPSVARKERTTAILLPNNSHNMELIVSQRLLICIGILVFTEVTAVTSNQEASNVTVPHGSTQNKSISTNVSPKSSVEFGEVTIYSTWLGIPYTLNVSGCTDVPSILYKKAESVETNKRCFLLYNRQNCTGRKIKVDPKEEGRVVLSNLDFEEDLASLQQCEDEKPQDSNHASTTNATAASVHRPTTLSQPKADSSSKAARNRRSPNDDDLQTALPVPAVSKSIPLFQRGNMTRNSGTLFIVGSQPSGSQQTVNLAQTSGDGTISTTSSSSTQVVSQDNDKSNKTGVFLTNIIY